jgi:hypothetical protein
MKKWVTELNSRPIEDKLTVSGRIDTALHGQTEAYLKPLFRKLKSRVWKKFTFFKEIINIFLLFFKENG